MRYEYKVLPAPTRGKRARKVKSVEGRFANALELMMNELGQDGWEYVRTDTLPCEKREGFRGKTTIYQNMLVFRRPLDQGAQRPMPASNEPVVMTTRASRPTVAEERRAKEPLRATPDLAAE